LSRFCFRSARNVKSQVSKPNISVHAKKSFFSKFDNDKTFANANEEKKTSPYPEQRTEHQGESYSKDPIFNEDLYDLSTLDKFELEKRNREQPCLKLRETVMNMSHEQTYRESKFILPKLSERLAGTSLRARDISSSLPKSQSSEVTITEKITPKRKGRSRIVRSSSLPCIQESFELEKSFPSCQNVPSMSNNNQLTFASQYHHRSEKIESQSKTNKQKLCAEDNNDRLVPGRYPQKLESLIVSKMKQIALKKSDEGCWEESYNILQNVLEVQQVSLGTMNPEVANTKYHIGHALKWMGKPKAALLWFESAHNILNLKNSSADKIKILKEIAMIQGEMGELDIEIRILKRVQSMERLVFGGEDRSTSMILRELMRA